MRIQPKNWEKFQHYKDRRPIWIKLHCSLLDDYKFHLLPIASKALAPFLWLLASEYEDGIIDAPDEEIAFRLRMSVGDLIKAVEPLISSTFFVMYQDDSNALADVYPDACLEKRREETEKSKNILFDFEKVWSFYPNKVGKKEALRHFRASVKTEDDYRDICTALSNYMRHLDNNQWKRPQNGSTWFNNWRDFIDWTEPTQGKTTDKTLDVIRRLNGGIDGLVEQDNHGTIIDIAGDVSTLPAKQ